MVFVMHMACVLSKVQTEYLYIIYTDVSVERTDVFCY